MKTDWGRVGNNNFDRLAQEDISGETTFEARCEHQEKGSRARRKQAGLFTKQKDTSVMEADPRRRGGAAGKREAGFLHVSLEEVR